MNRFYEDLEAPIRPIVKLLRDNGWNTTCSCGHGMWVELDLPNRFDEVDVLASFLNENGIKKFKIDAELFAGECLWTRRAKVWIGDWPMIDVVSYKELTNKIQDLKLMVDKIQQENYKLRQKRIAKK
jgi:N-dimethylarginine dimethylaminohydrolase